MELIGTLLSIDHAQSDLISPARPSGRASTVSEDFSPIFYSKFRAVALPWCTAQSLAEPVRLDGSWKRNVSHFHEFTDEGWNERAKGSRLLEIPTALLFVQSLPRHKLGQDFGCPGPTPTGNGRKSFARSIFGSTLAFAITSLPIGSPSLPTQHRHASPVSIQTEASRRKGRQTGCQTEGGSFIHHNINPNGICLRKLGDHAHHEPVCRWQHRGSECHGKTQACDRKVSMFFPPTRPASDSPFSGVPLASWSLTRRAGISRWINTRSPSMGDF